MKVFIDLDGTVSEYCHRSGKVELEGKYDKGMFIEKKQQKGKKNR